MDTLAGRLPADTDTRTLQMSQFINYLDSSDLPVAYGLQPDSVPPPSEAAPENEFKNCVPAAMAYLAQAWQNEEDKEQVTLEQSLLVYEQVSPFRIQRVEDEKLAGDRTAVRTESARTRTHNDYGASLLLALKRWTDADNPISQELLAEASSFVEVEPRNLRQLKEAIYHFGGVLLGIDLPQHIQASWDGEDRPVWFVPGYGPIFDATPGSLTSHCVAVIGYRDDHFICFTGGKVVTMSPEFVRTYTVECYAVQRAEMLQDNPALKDAIECKVTALRSADRPRFQPAFSHRWHGASIM
jgi:hypothetical protein